ncbi:MAG: hypothetical protein ACLSX5_00515 [Lachnospiraceae bacterium]
MDLKLGRWGICQLFTAKMVKIDCCLGVPPAFWHRQISVPLGIGPGNTQQCQVHGMQKWVFMTEEVFVKK